ncbi:CBN-TWK-9 protein [Caenorhabditis brenneri]|uniref:CBN-TWK-9 protein n=1 Tax=Caenorhabditis brenneri TaxID=135651 RepID=G0PAX0_CAEBE|nr:CBN-TWK-9 protein [Caenorhabditis brenneri]
MARRFAYYLVKLFQTAKKRKAPGEEEEKQGDGVEDEEEEEEEKNEEPSFDYLFITLIYIGIGLALTTMAIEIAADLLKKLHYIGRKMENVGQAVVWFGGKNFDYLFITLIYIGIGLALTTMAIEIAADLLKKLHYIGRKMENVGQAVVWFGGKNRATFKRDVPALPPPPPITGLPDRVTRVYLGEELALLDPAHLNIENIDRCYAESNVRNPVEFGGPIKKKTKKKEEKKEEVDEGPPPEKWSIGNSVIFAFTVITTIGYGHVAPETFEGRLFLICYGVIGVPFTLLTIADLGMFLTKFLKYLLTMARRFAYFLVKLFQTAKKRRAVSCKEPGEGEEKQEDGEEEEEEEEEKNEEPSFDYLFITLIYIGIGLALTTMAIEIAADLLKKLHYIGRKMENVGQAVVWFGGKK